VIPLRCYTFAMRIASQRQVYGVLAFWVAIVDTMRFVSQSALQVSICEGLRFAKVNFYLLYYGDSTRDTRGRSQLQK
jgi:hypothetical protein